MQVKPTETASAVPQTLRPDEVGSLIRRTPSFRNTKDKKALAVEQHGWEDEGVSGGSPQGSPTRPPTEMDDKGTRVESLKKEKPKRTLSLKTRKHTPR